MKKIMFSVIALLILFVGIAFAADKADNAQHVLTTAAIGDASSGDCAEVDSSGNLAVKLATGTNSVGTVVLGAGTAEAGKVKISDGTEQAAVDTDNNLMVENDGCLAKYCTESQLVVTGAGTLNGIIVSGPTAGDQVFVYDAVNANKNLTIANVKIAANTSTASVMFPRGINITNGIYVIGTDADVNTTVLYDDSQT